MPASDTSTQRTQALASAAQAAGDDLIRYRRAVGGALAIEGQALRQRKATPAASAREAEAAGVWGTMEPCVMALTSDA